VHKSENSHTVDCECPLF